MITPATATPADAKRGWLPRRRLAAAMLALIVVVVFVLTWAAVQGSRNKQRIKRLTEMGVTFYEMPVFQDWVNDLSGGYLTRFKRIYFVTIDNERFDDGALEDLCHVDTLAQIMIPKSAVTDAGLRHLSRLENLNTLSLYSCPNITDNGMEYLAKHTQLLYLSIGSPRITNEGLKRLAPLTSLEHLDLIDTNITDDGLAQLEAFPKLWGLELWGGVITGRGLAALAEKKTITYLQLRNLSNLDDEGMKAATSLPGLTHIDLGGERITDDRLALLRHASQLKNLSLLFTPITDEGLKHVLELKNLRYLHLQDAQSVTDKSVPTLQKMRLEHLALYQTRISTTGQAQVKGVAKSVMIEP